MVDPFDGLDRLGEEALGPCAGCGKLMLATDSPIFSRITIEQCGIDGKVVQERVGLAMTMGGGRDGLALAGILGPRCKPVIVVNRHPAINVCYECGLRLDFLVLDLIAKVISPVTPDNDTDEEDDDD